MKFNEIRKELLCVAGIVAFFAAGIILLNITEKYHGKNSDPPSWFSESTGMERPAGDLEKQRCCPPEDMVIYVPGAGYVKVYKGAFDDPNRSMTVEEFEQYYREEPSLNPKDKINT